jgi:sodium transport system permease protein
MMRTLVTVFRKEVLDNVRDRRTLMSALLMGPFFGPILFAFVINLSIERSLDDIERLTTLPVIGAEHAPNLMRFLESRNIEIVEGPADRDAALSAVQTGIHDVVVIVPPEFGVQLADSIPARVELVGDQANTQADRESRRVRNALHAYNRQLASIRLTARGVSPAVMRPINIDEIDMSTPSGRSAVLLGMMSYFFIFALLMGGMYLAIDTTAGERERGSLEPLLALPVTRDQLLVGKIAATCLFMALSLCLSLTSFYFALKFMPLEQLGMTPNFGPATVVADPARRRDHDPGRFVHQELSRGANLAQCRVARADTADPDRQYSHPAAAPGVHVRAKPEPAPLARGHGEKRASRGPARGDFRGQHTAARHDFDLDLCPSVPPRGPARLTNPANSPTWGARVQR